jgi:V/A-type H+-transporting ATPase subunit E
MGLEELIDRIKQEARSEAEIIMEEARKKADSVKKEEEARLRKELDEREKKLQKEIKNTRNIHISDGKRKARQALLSAKEDLIWETISLVRKRFSEMGPQELETYLHPMFDKASSSLGQDMMVYPIREMDSEILSKMKDVHSPLEEMEDPPETVSRYRGKDMIGGFIAVASDGKKVVNMTFSGILEKEEERIREAIARKLFGE